MGPVIDPKILYVQEKIGFLSKNQLYLNLYAINNDRIVTQYTPKLSIINYHIFVHQIITSFSVT